MKKEQQELTGFENEDAADRYIVYEETFTIASGLYRVRVYNRRVDFILTLPSKKEVRDNLFELEKRKEIYQLLGEDQEILNWLEDIKEAVEEKYIKDYNSDKLVVTRDTPKYKLVSNYITGCCTLFFHKKYLDNLNELKVGEPIRLKG